MRPNNPLPALPTPKTPSLPLPVLPRTIRLGLRSLDALPRELALPPPDAEILGPANGLGEYDSVLLLRALWGQDGACQFGGVC